ncbi:hypothetical protein Ga0061079_1344 [Apibacter mensalis]|uniref:Uncharacterized protein n=1 Tax=Apibacter mensalis TaxID=1586267 RepID=A0A0X3AT49_9FLAO|nr:hypothetical protein [Apibacter mensalis]CVK17257.1 hypothetical protein Ga0061079_1344 [Apibacter mensalis]
MRTNIEVIDLIYQILKPLEEGLSGGIYKIQRPANSNKEDIVINSLILASGDIQKGTFNINIHVPDLLIKFKNQTQNQPDLKRLKELNKLVKSKIDEIYNEDYNLFVLWENTLKDIDAKNHYINIRIQFISYKAYFN